MLGKKRQDEGKGERVRKTKAGVWHLSNYRLGADVWSVLRWIWINAPTCGIDLGAGRRAAEAAGEVSVSGMRGHKGSHKNPRVRSLLLWSARQPRCRHLLSACHAVMTSRGPCMNVQLGLCSAVCGWDLAASFQLCSVVPKHTKAGVRSSSVTVYASSCFHKTLILKKNQLTNQLFQILLIVFNGHIWFYDTHSFIWFLRGQKYVILLYKHFFMFISNKNKIKTRKKNGQRPVPKGAVGTPAPSSTHMSLYIMNGFNIHNVHTYNMHWFIINQAPIYNCTIYVINQSTSSQ